MKFKDFFPKTFFGRSLAIILIPVLLLQCVLIYVFYERHWDDVGRRLALAIGGQVSFIIDNISNNNLTNEEIISLFDRAESSFLIKSELDEAGSLKNIAQHKVSSLLDNTLYQSLRERIKYPYKFDTKSVKNKVLIYVELEKYGLFKFVVARKTLYSSTIEVFMGWMLFTAVLLVALALHFMNQQIKPLRNIMLAAEEFGKGNNNFILKPRGAYELRLLSDVFIKMRERIKNQITQRTQMLAGIGHDLRTPLTRMKLQIALLKDKNAIDSLTNDVQEMREMIDDYLTFAKGEGEEKFSQQNIKKLLVKIIKKINHSEIINVKLNIENELVVFVKALAIKRALSNIISNAVNYANNTVKISTCHNKKYITLIIEDDGPGIPENKRLDVFKAFYRVDKSRSSSSGNSGLGLTIAKNIIQDHSGLIKLFDSDLGGLRVEVILKKHLL